VQSFSANQKNKHTHEAVKIMRITDAFFGLSLVLLAVGCSKKEVDLSDLEKAFKGTEAQLVVQQANDANQLPAQDPQTPPEAN
jgi:Na+-translocating ferredoxin:NAD+ oxidoreductase RnfA subunit